MRSFAFAFHREVNLAYNGMTNMFILRVFFFVFFFPFLFPFFGIFRDHNGDSLHTGRADICFILFFLLTEIGFKKARV